MIPRSSKLGSFCNSIVSNTAPEGTPTAISFSIASRLSCWRVHSLMIASSSCSFLTRASPVAKAEARFDRRTVGLAGDADRAAGSLRDHVEGQPLLVRAAAAKALDLAIDDAGVELFDRVVVEAEALDRAGRHVFDRDVGLLQ